MTSQNNKVDTGSAEAPVKGVGCGALVSTPGYHELKTWPDFFAAVRSGAKRFELRKNDRDFREGDSVRLREWSPSDASYTGREIVAKIGYLTDWPGSLVEGHVCFALEQVISC